MSRIVLVHWNAEEAREKAARLRKAGHTVRVHWKQQGEGLKPLRKSPPEALVIDLGRLPSHGRTVAAWFRETRAGRRMPIVFVGGEQSKVKAVRKLLPDAVYTEWSSIRSALRAALANPPADPVNPGVLAGYSKTPLPKKLGIKAGTRVALLGAPRDFESTLGTLPEKVIVKRQARGAAEVVLLFAKTRADLKKRFSTATRTTGPKGRLWIVWRKQASGQAGDLGSNQVREFGLSKGWVDFKICAVDKTWSGLCFARRRS